MKKLLSVLLTVVMLVVPVAEMTAFAAPSIADSFDAADEVFEQAASFEETAKTSDDNDGYNSIKIPVINEVRNENDENEKTAGLMGEGSSSLMAEPYALTITGIPAQTQSKGGILYIENVKDYLTYANGNAIDNFFQYNWCGTVIEFTKSGTTKTLYYSASSYYKWEDALYVPVPKELANGTYSVKVHSLGEMYNYIEGYSDYTELIFSFNLTVTAEDADSADYSFNNINALADDSFSICEGSYDIPGISLKNELPGETYLGGYAVDADGNMFAIDGECDGETMWADDSISYFPAGTYTCYFHVVADPYSWDEAWEDFDFNDLYGPVTIYITSLEFDDEYLYPSQSEQYVGFDFEASVAKKIHHLENDGLTLSLDFKDEDSRLVYSLSGLAVEYFYAYYYNYGSGYEYGYGSINFSASFSGFAEGTYMVDVTLTDNTGTDYELGMSVIKITEKTVINRANILNYYGTFTPETESFYVELDTSNIFLDYEELSVSLIDKYGDVVTGGPKVVAQTVSKALKSVSSYSGSNLLYKLEVTETLKTNGSYSLEISYPESLPIITSLNSVYIRVTSSPIVVRAEFLEPNIVKFYTENMPAGEYMVTDEYSLSDSGAVYTVEVDEDGVGTFTMDSVEMGEYYHFYIRYADETDDYDYIDYFSFSTRDGGYDYFYSSPGYIYAGAAKIQSFAARINTDTMTPEASDVEYARITQNGVVMATVSNISFTNKSFYSSSSVCTPIATLKGTVNAVSGKKLVKGEAYLEVKFKSGLVYTHSIPVTDATTGLYGSFSIDNSANYYSSVGNEWCESIVGTNKVSFTISGTNITSGTVSLYKVDSETPLQTLNLSKLTKTTADSYYYTYKGTFTTTLAQNTVYYIVLSANDKTKTSADFAYYSGKYAYQGDNLSSYNGELDVYLYNCINISNPKSVTIKAVSGNNTYNLPVKSVYGGTTYVSLVVNTSSLPAGSFSIKAYEGTNEIKLSGTVSGFNYGNVTTPSISGSGWAWTGTNKDVISYRIYGANLDKISSASVKVYKPVDFPDGGSYDRHKLRYVTEIALSKPYNESYIAVDTSKLSKLETGSYTIVYILDGEPVEVDNIYVEGLPKDNTVYVTDVFLDKSSASLKIGDTLTLTATVYPSNATNKDVTWTSSDSSVATVENGVVTAKANGTATITVTTADGGMTATCTVTVCVPVTSVSLDKTAHTLEVGDTLTLTATVKPSDATNKNVTWTSSDDDVATVENGVVTAKGKGTAAITVTTEDGAKTAKCDVTVVDTRTQQTVVYTDIDRSKVTLGSEITFTVSLSGTYDGYSFELAKAFDGFEITSVVSDDSGNADDMGEYYRVSVLGGKDREYSRKIKVATVTARVDENAALGEKTLSLNNVMISSIAGLAANFTTSYATVEITDRTPGDINGDGTFNYYDVSKLYAYYRNKTTLDISEEEKDINNDGIFNYYDVSKLYAIYRGKAGFGE